MIELYHWEPNVHFLKPLIALAEKQTPFVSCWFDPTRFEQFQPQYPHNEESALHLEREGPLLVDAGVVISSTFFMLEYISEAVPGPALLTGDSWVRYQARAWSQFLGATIGPVVSALGCARYLASVLHERDQELLQAQIARIEPRERRAQWQAVLDGTYNERVLSALHLQLARPVGRVEERLAQSVWLAGPTYTIADIDAFALLDPLLDLAPEVVNEQATPRVFEFIQRMGNRPAVRTALACSRTGSPRTAFVPGAEGSRWG